MPAAMRKPSSMPYWSTDICEVGRKIRLSEGEEVEEAEQEVEEWPISVRTVPRSVASTRLGAEVGSKFQDLAELKRW